jgi:hypothetical protein
VGEGSILRPGFHGIILCCTESPKEVRGYRFNDCRVAFRQFVTILPPHRASLEVVCRAASGGF